MHHDGRVECFSLALNGLEVVAEGITFGFYFDVFHFVVLSASPNINNMFENSKLR